MPTGYTAIIEDNKDVTFKDYIMGCARAFGACIEMRDEPQDKKIPKEFYTDTYNLDELRKSKNKLKEINKLSDAQLEEESEKAFNKKLRQHKASIKKYSEIEKRYKRMMVEVESWQPPTKDHKSLKDFMIQQIETCTQSSMAEYLEKEIAELELWTGKRWKFEQLKKVKRDIKYHTKEHDKEIKRMANRNQWLKDLRRSINI